jgi:hypothetical protein
VFHIRSLLPLLLCSACDGSLYRSVLYYNLDDVEPAPPGQHYQQFAELTGGVADLGCFAVEYRQFNCFDARGDGSPNLRPVVVECACPCTERGVDPCDEARSAIAGTIRGIVDHADLPLQLGGIEFPSTVDLARASEIFITVEPDEDDDPRPSRRVLVRASLQPRGTVLWGLLRPPGPLELARGRVSVAPVRDGAQL